MPKDQRHKKEVLHWAEAARLRREHQASQRLKMIIRQNRIAQNLREVVSRDFVVFDGSSDFIPEDRQAERPDVDEMRDQINITFADLQSRLPENPISYWATTTSPDGAEYN